MANSPVFVARTPNSKSRWGVSLFLSGRRLSESRRLATAWTVRSKHQEWEGIGRYPKITIFMGQIEIVVANMGMYCHLGFRWAHVSFQKSSSAGFSIFFHFNLHWKLTSTSNVLLLGCTKIAYPKVQWFIFFLWFFIFVPILQMPRKQKVTVLTLWDKHG